MLSGWLFTVLKACTVSASISLLSRLIISKLRGRMSSPPCTFLSWGSCSLTHPTKSKVTFHSNRSEQPVQRRSRLFKHLMLLYSNTAFKHLLPNFLWTVPLTVIKTQYNGYELGEAETWQVSHHANKPSDAHAVSRCWGAFINRQQWTVGTKTTFGSRVRAQLNYFFRRGHKDTAAVLDGLCRLHFCPHPLCS